MFGFVVGLVVLLSTFTSVLALGVVGFLIMLFCLLVIERNVRKMGRAGLESLTGSVRGGAIKGLFGDDGAPLAGALEPRRRLPVLIGDPTA